MLPLKTRSQFVFVFSILIGVYAFAQNKQILYEFDELPQTLLLNPGTDVSYDKHISVPLTNIYFQFGATNTNLSYNSVISNTDDFNDILDNIYENNPDKDDYFIINQQIELINAGFRLKNRDMYLSFGMYEEFDGFATYPEQLVELFYKGDDKNDDGIPELNVPSSFHELNITGDFIGVFHVGISNKFSENLTIGTRLKLISGSASFNSNKNTGIYSLSLSNAPFDHNFSNMDVVMNSSGLIDIYGNEIFGGFGDNLSGLFFGKGNFGVGLDLGGTYHISNEFTVTASVLDLGFVNYSNEITSYVFKKDFVLKDDTYFDPPEGQEMDYWNKTMTDYYNDGQIPMDTLQVSYNSNRAPKINSSFKYTFYNEKKTGGSAYRNVKCYKCLSDYTALKSELGVQTYTIFRPNRIGWAVTAFYTREFNKYIKGKITYTYDNFSMYNLGVGLSTHYKNLNFYVTADNLLNLFQIKDSNYQSFQFGLNFIFKNKN